MKKEALIYGIVGLVVGGLLVGLTASFAVNNNNQDMMRMMGMNTSRMMGSGDDHMGMSMDQMSDQLKNRTGDDFDENFTSMMIAHHQGAINMANLAKSNAKHQEVKNMADEIISAQSKEIEMMQAWQSDWGYKNMPKNHMMDN